MTFEQLKQQLEQLNSQVEKLNKVFADFEASNRSSNILKDSSNKNETKIAPKVDTNNKDNKDDKGKKNNAGNQKQNDTKYPAKNDTTKVSNQNRNKTDITDKGKKVEKSDKFGYFDGKYMVTDEGEKFEIYSNYAAKSKLVYGDKMKMYVDDRGRNMFKQVEKIERKELEGFLTQHEDQWLFVTHSGSFKVSSAAVEHQNGKDGDEVVAIVPRDIADASFATLDRAMKDSNVPEAKKTSSDDKNAYKGSTTRNNAKNGSRHDSQKNKSDSSNKSSSKRNSNVDSKQKPTQNSQNKDSSKTDSNSNQQKGDTKKTSDNSSSDNSSKEAPLTSDTELKILFEDDLR